MGKPFLDHLDVVGNVLLCATHLCRVIGQTSAAVAQDYPL